MGHSESKEVIIREVESDEGMRARLQGMLDSQLATMKDDVLQVHPVITDNVLETLNEISDALVIRYSNLKSKDEISKNIREIIGYDALPQVTEFLVETATRMVSAMQSTEEMKEVMRWQRRKQVVKVDDKVVGMEAHYRVKLLEEKSRSYLPFGSKDTVVMIGYKIYVHSLNADPNNVLSTDQLKKLTF